MLDGTTVSGDDISDIRASCGAAPPPDDAEIPEAICMIVRWFIDRAPARYTFTAEGRLGDSTGLSTDYLVVAAAHHLLLAGLRTRAVRAIEIGVLEGRGTAFLLDEVLQHPDSRLLAIDPFVGMCMEAVCPGGEEMRRRWGENIAQTEAAAKVSVDPRPSSTALRERVGGGAELSDEAGAYDFIYIDGSHELRDILEDAVLAWALLREGGTLLFDDYNAATAPAIDGFAACYAVEAVLLARSNKQLYLRKVARRARADAEEVVAVTAAAADGGRLELRVGGAAPPVWEQVLRSCAPSWEPGQGPGVVGTFMRHHECRELLRQADGALGGGGVETQRG